MTQERRCKIVPISPDMLYSLFTTSDKAAIQRCTEGLPADARFISHGYDVLRNKHYLVFESAEWDIVPEFQYPPELNIQFMRYDIGYALERASALIRKHAMDDPHADAWFQEYAEFAGVLS